ncbi:unnamed protein product [Rangifer tarandus platyrhynchus]|uniref:Uncharacterized protein n=2 Tax=Rangifer tarandus platyrhynchus TaxID=3082113 RepID=A0ABN8ZQQ4_RANTA|nr:unnamed protein product [Rangifer tarandus platyrhynchus]CAI9707084.1 unnamed protein product [Rangifer tarandus platyrhynchus]
MRRSTSIFGSPGMLALRPGGRRQEMQKSRVMQLRAASQSLPSSSPANKLAVAAGDSTLMTIAGPAAAAGLAQADGTTFPFQASMFKRCAPGGPGGDPRPLTSRVGHDSERRCWTRDCALAIHVRRERLWPRAAESLRVLMRGPGWGQGGGRRQRRDVRPVAGGQLKLGNI